MSLQAGIELFALGFSQRNGFRTGGNAIPDLLDQPKAIFDRQCQYVTYRYVSAHDNILAVVTSRRQDGPARGFRGECLC